MPRSARNKRRIGPLLTSLRRKEFVLAVLPWEVLADFGIASLLLLVGQYLRSRLGMLQRLFLPASVIGGFIGLGLGPNGANIL